MNSKFIQRMMLTVIDRIGTRTQNLKQVDTGQRSGPEAYALPLRHPTMPMLLKNIAREGLTGVWMLDNQLWRWC